MKLYRVSDILWDTTSGEDTLGGLFLPRSMFVYAESDDMVADALSDAFGFCINSLSIEVIEGPMVI